MQQPHQQPQTQGFAKHGVQPYQPYPHQMQPNPSHNMNMGMNQFNQMNQVNQMNQMSQMNQINQTNQTNQMNPPFTQYASKEQNAYDWNPSLCQTHTCLQEGVQHSQDTNTTKPMQYQTLPEHTPTQPLDFPDIAPLSLNSQSLNSANLFSNTNTLIEPTSDHSYMQSHPQQHQHAHSFQLQISPFSAHESKTPQTNVRASANTLVSASLKKGGAKANQFLLNKRSNSDELFYQTPPKRETPANTAPSVPPPPTNTNISGHTPLLSAPLMPEEVKVIKTPRTPKDLSRGLVSNIIVGIKKGKPIPGFKKNISSSGSKTLLRIATAPPIEDFNFKNFTGGKVVVKKKNRNLSTDSSVESVSTSSFLEICEEDKNPPLKSKSKSSSQVNVNTANSSAPNQGSSSTSSLTNKEFMSPKIVLKTTPVRSKDAEHTPLSKGLIYLFFTF